MRRPRVVAIVGATALVSVTIALVSSTRHNRDLAAHQAITGELVAYDASSRDLTIRTTDGNRHFFVRAGTPVHEGAHTTSLTALPSTTGCRVKIWWSNEGRPAVYEIRVSCDEAVRSSDSRQ